MGRFMVILAVVFGAFSGVVFGGEIDTSELRIGRADRAFNRAIKSSSKRIDALGERQKTVAKKLDATTLELDAIEEEIAEEKVLRRCVWVELALSQWADVMKDPLHKKLDLVVTPRKADGKWRIIVVADAYNINTEIETAKDKSKFVEQLGRDVMFEVKDISEPYDIGIAIVSVGAPRRTIKKNIDYGVIAYSREKDTIFFVKMSALKRDDATKEKTAPKKLFPKLKPWWSRIEDKEDK